jgi:hypothetical protein
VLSSKRAARQPAAPLGGIVGRSDDGDRTGLEERPQVAHGLSLREETRQEAQFLQYEERRINPQLGQRDERRQRIDFFRIPSRSIASPAMTVVAIVTVFWEESAVTLPLSDGAALS